MTSVQTLPSIHSTKIHHTASSPVVKPSPHAFKVVESSSKKMNGHVNGSGGQENGAPAASSEQVKKHWNDFGAMIQGLLQTPIQFTRYDNKDDVHPEPKYKALNTGSSNENGSGLAGLTKSSFSYGESPISRTGTPVSTASTATDADNTVPSDHDLHPKAVETRWPHQGNYNRASGLQNMGNTCFANSVLQVMMHTPPLLRMLDDLSGHDGNHRRNGKICLTCELKTTKQAVWRSGRGTHNPAAITSNVKSICPTMRRGRQEDSHEFFRYSVDALQNENLRELGATKAPHSVRETSWVHKVWGGRLRSRVHCTSCGANSDTFDTFLDLSLDIARDTRSVQEALKGFAREDKLEGRNKYKCEKCNKQVVAVKTMRVVQSPPVLSLHLKRFSPFGKKLTQPINFEEKLVLTSPIYEGGRIEYELYGVTLHYGSGPNNGHYISIVKNARKEWCKMDDSDVSIQPHLSSDDKRNTYQLHYIRKSGDRLAEAIGQSAKAKAASSAKQGRPDLGRSYGATENGPAFDEPGTSQSHARRAEAEQAQAVIARKTMQANEHRGMKRSREDALDEGVPVEVGTAQAKKARAGNAKFQPVQGADFYAGKPRPASPEDRDATDEEDGWADEQATGSNGREADQTDGAPEHGSWGGSFEPVAKNKGRSPQSHVRGTLGHASPGRKGKEIRRQRTKHKSPTASPYFASRKKEGKHRGHGVMKGKEH